MDTGLKEAWGGAESPKMIHLLACSLILIVIFYLLLTKPDAMVGDLCIFSYLSQQCREVSAVPFFRGDCAFSKFTGLGSDRDRTQSYIFLIPNGCFFFYIIHPFKRHNCLRLCSYIIHQLKTPVHRRSLSQCCVTPKPFPLKFPKSCKSKYDLLCADRGTEG